MVVEAVQEANPSMLSQPDMLKELFVKRQQDFRTLLDAMKHLEIPYRGTDEEIVAFADEAEAIKIEVRARGVLGGLWLVGWFEQHHLCVSGGSKMGSRGVERCRRRHLLCCGDALSPRSGGGDSTRRCSEANSVPQRKPSFPRAGCACAFPLLEAKLEIVFGDIFISEPPLVSCLCLNRCSALSEEVKGTGEFSSSRPEARRSSATTISPYPTPCTICTLYNHNLCAINPAFRNP